MTTTRTRRTLHKASSLNNDEGSLILVILFTIILAALTLVVTLTMISGLTKTRNTRDYSVAFQASDIAFADVTMRANMGQFNSMAVGTSATGSGVTVGNDVYWKWTATKATPRTLAVEVQAKGKSVDRNFTGTLKGTQVYRALRDPSTGAVRYVAGKNEYFENGFFGGDSLQVAGAPDVDGYNGDQGTLGSNATLTLDNASTDSVLEANWTTDTGRCTGAACSTAKIQRLKQRVTFPQSDIITACATNYGDWTPASGPLVAGRCYNSLNFNANYTGNLSGMVYVKAGGVTVQPGVLVNTTSSSTNAPSSRLRIATLGGYTQTATSKVAAAIYAPQGNCLITGEANQSYRTVWLGAATCKTFRVVANPRLRFDGGLDLVFDSSTASGAWFWSLYDYSAVN